MNKEPESICYFQWYWLKLGGFRGIQVQHGLLGQESFLVYGWKIDGISRLGRLRMRIPWYRREIQKGTLPTTLLTLRHQVTQRHLESRKANNRLAGAQESCRLYKKCLQFTHCLLNEWFVVHRAAVNHKVAKAQRPLQGDGHWLPTRIAKWADGPQGRELLPNGEVPMRFRGISHGFRRSSLRSFLRYPENCFPAGTFTPFPTKFRLQGFVVWFRLNCRATIKASYSNSQQMAAWVGLGMHGSQGLPMTNCAKGCLNGLHRPVVLRFGWTHHPQYFRPTWWEQLPRFCLRKSMTSSPIREKD